MKIKCLECGKDYTPILAADTRGMQAWEAGDLVQDTFPFATTEECDQLIVSMCSTACFDNFLSGNSKSDPKEVETATLKALNRLHL